MIACTIVCHKQTLCLSYPAPCLLHMSNYVTQNRASAQVDESDKIEWDDNGGWGDDDDEGWGEDDEEAWDEPVTGKTQVGASQIKTHRT